MSAAVRCTSTASKAAVRKGVRVRIPPPAYRPPNGFRRWGASRFLGLFGDSVADSDRRCPAGGLDWPSKPGVLGSSPSGRTTKEPAPQRFAALGGSRFSGVSANSDENCAKGSAFWPNAAPRKSKAPRPPEGRRGAGAQGKSRRTECVTSSCESLSSRR